MSKRFVVLVIDSFGIGAMDDVIEYNSTDVNANTLKSILEANPDARFVNLEKMGLMNAAGFETEMMKYSKTAVYGVSELEHHGADSFMGHQEIAGSKMPKPEKKPFNTVIEETRKILEENGHKVEYRGSGETRYLLVDDYATVADNIDTAPGMAYNVTAPLDYMSFEDELAIARLVRKVAKVNRVICFGGRGNNIDDLLNAEEVPEEGFIGIVAVKSKSYVDDYHCMHLGYGVDENTQVSASIAKKGIKSYFIGKTADMVNNPYGEVTSCVPTDEVMKKTIETYRNIEEGFIYSNIQETDLAGHSEDPQKYRQLIDIADQRIGELLDLMDKDDILIVMADHGNDPLIGHNQHTRERVPLLIHYGDKKGINIGIRKTMSDIGATVADYFEADELANGTSFLDLLK